MEGGRRGRKREGGREREATSDCVLEAINISLSVLYPLAQALGIIEIGGFHEGQDKVLHVASKFGLKLFGKVLCVRVRVRVCVCECIYD